MHGVRSFCTLAIPTQRHSTKGGALPIPEEPPEIQILFCSSGPRVSDSNSGRALESHAEAQWDKEASPMMLAALEPVTSDQLAA